jgi:hypothetical protein
VGLLHIPDAMTDAAAIDAPADASPPCPLVAMKPSTMFPSAPGTVEIAIPDAATAGLVTIAGSIYLRSPLSTSSSAGPKISAATHPALVPDGSRVFVSQGGAITAADQIGSDLSTWMPTSSSDVPAGMFPGTPSDAGPEMHMVVDTGTAFQEYRHSSMGWISEMTYPAAAIGPGGAIGYPALTRDGRVLVFVVSGLAAGVDGIWGVTRMSLTDTFDGSSGRAVQLVAATTLTRRI